MLRRADWPDGFRSKLTHEALRAHPRRGYADMLVLFDIDDTLLDDAAAQRRAAATLHAQLGFKEDIAQFLSLWAAASQRHYARYLQGELDFQGQRRARVREVVGGMGDADADALFASYLDAYESAWALCEDAARCLDALRGQHRLGVVSNGQGAQQRRKLAALGIDDRFECIVISEDVGCRKPEPEIFRQACAKLSVSPEEAAYVGDRYEIDALGARAAGLSGIWLDRLGLRAGRHLPPVVASLDSLQDVVGGLDPMGGSG